MLTDTSLYIATQALLENKINDTIKSYVDELKRSIVEVLTDEEQRKINVPEYIDNLWKPVSINLSLNQIRKNRSKKELEEETRCVARIGLGTQCTRSKISGDYCKSHNIALPYGRIDGPLEGKAIKIPKRRGRKARDPKNFTLSDIDLTKYVQATIINIEGDVLIQDEHGMLYKHDASNQIIGRTTDSGIEWY